MPITNWHSARLQDPAKFDSKTWKTTAGGTIYGSKKIPFSINIIWGKLKGKAKPADPPIAQALRFPKFRSRKERSNCCYCPDGWTFAHLSKRDSTYGPSRGFSFT